MISASIRSRVDRRNVASLAQYGKIKSVKISDRANLYWKADIDPYVVEERGVKSGRAKRIAAKPKQKKRPPHRAEDKI